MDLELANLRDALREADLRVREADAEALRLLGPGTSELPPLEGTLADMLSLLGYVGVEVPLPVLQRGQGDAAVAKAHRELAEAQRAALLNETRRKLAIATHSSRSSRERVERHRTEALRRADQLRRAARSTYQAGGAELSVLLDAEHSHRDAALRLVDLELAAVRAGNELQFVSGAWDSQTTR